MEQMNWNVIAMNNISASAAAEQEQQQQQLVNIRALIRKMACTFVSRFRTTSASLQMQPTADDDQITTAGDEDRDVHIRGSGSNPDEEDEDVQCIICLYDVISGEKYRVLQPCKHAFHLQCIHSWLHNHSTCPLCRCPVPYAAASIEEDHQSAALHDDDDAAMLSFSYVVAFLNHFCRWFVNPLGFDAEACEQHPNYLI